MTYDHGLLRCKSVSPYFEAEISGIKPNTVRIVPAKELVALAQCKRMEVTRAVESDVCVLGFKQAITSMVDITDALAMSGCEIPAGMHAVSISWAVAS